MTLTAASYATTADLQGYIQASIASDNSSFWTSALAAVSRFIDDRCGQYFYAAGTATRYFNGDGTRHMDTGQHPFYGATTVQQAHFENEPISLWLTVQGDGITPGASNYWYYPSNPRLIGSVSSNTATRPFYGLDLAIIPQPNTTYLPSFVPGYKTISITANWGWPVVPDDIKNLTLKIAARMWNQFQASWQTVKAVPDVGGIDISRYFDAMDDMMLRNSDYKLWSQGTV